MSLGKATAVSLEEDLANKVWVKNGSTDWSLVTVVSRKEGKIQVLDKKTNTHVTLADDAWLPVNTTVTEDMTALHNLHEPGILFNLRKRYERHQIYTYMASALIAVNPFTNLPEPNIADYARQGNGNLPPHPYAISETCYRNLAVLKRNQSVVISGESGAGKTETAKIIIRYLASRATNRFNEPTASLSTAHQDTNSDDLYAKLQQLSPVLESFGNAKTARNNNSSRFGKFMKLLFDTHDTSSHSSSSKKMVSKSAPANPKQAQQQKLTLTGAMIETYMLEKSRVIYQSYGESNFHIFYALLSSSINSGSNNSGNTIFSLLDSAISYRIAPLQAPTANDSEDLFTLPAITQALRTLGLSTVTIDDLYRVLIGLLNLGNITFEGQETSAGTIAQISSIPSAEYAPLNPTASSSNAGRTDNRRSLGGYKAPSGLLFLKRAAEGLRVDVQVLKALLTTREMETRGEKYTVPLTVPEAQLIRDATIKAIYEAVFARLVILANRALLQHEGVNNNPGNGANSAQNSSTYSVANARALLQRVESASFIGVLDIFGFESFAINGFEQLLINYANEALQDTFNQQIFAKELQLFEEEDIDVSLGTCPSNQACVQLLSAKSESVFAILDTMSRQPQPSDARFCEELHKCFARSSQASGQAKDTPAAYWGAVHKKDMRSVFVVHHYAHTVRYHVGPVDVHKAHQQLLQESGGGSGAEGKPTAAASAVHHESTAVFDSTWIVKNNDSIPDALEDVLLASSSNFVQSLSTLHLQAGLAGASDTVPSATTATGGVKPTKRRKSVMMKPTIAATFARSMQELTQMLDTTSCHFVRCIKPNVKLLPGMLESTFVLEQMRALGIVQACEVLKVSLPTRILYADLKAALHPTVRRVAHLFHNSGDSSEEEGGDVLLIAALFRAYRIPTDAYRLGLHRAFFKVGQLSVLEGLLAQGVPSVQEENRIVQEVESLVHRYHLVIRTIFQQEQQLATQVETLQQIETKHQRLKARSLLLPAHQGVDIPEHIALRVTTIENRAKALRLQQNDQLRHLSTLETLIGTLSEHHQTVHRLVQQKEVARDWVTGANPAGVNSASFSQSLLQHRNRITRLREKIDTFATSLDSATANYTHISSLIDDLEDAQIKANDAPKLLIMVHDQEILFEATMTHINETEAKIIAVRRQAERGDFESLQEHETFIQDAVRGVAAASKDLQTGLAVASSLLTELERSAEHLDFRPIDTAIDQVLHALHEAGEVGAQEDESYAKYVQELQKDIDACVRVIDSTKPPPAPKPAPAPVPAPAPAPTTAATAASASASAPQPPQPRPSVVKYGLKDLAALTRNGSISAAEVTLLGPDGRPIKPTRGSTTSTTTTNTNTNTDPAAPKGKPATASTTYVLPAGWKEYFDAKSQRPYYVNKETKERQWKRPAGTVLMNTAALTASHAQSAASLTRSTGGGNSNGNLQSLADAPNSTSSNRSGGSATAITRNAAKKQLDHGDEDEEDSLLASLDAPRTSATALSLLQRQSMRATSMRLQAGDIAKLAAQTSPTHSAQPPTNALPVPWREVLDKKSGRFYYVNDVTKARQWRRPTAIDTLNSPETDTSPEQRRRSARLPPDTTLLPRTLSRRFEALTDDANHHEQPLSATESTAATATKRHSLPRPHLPLPPQHPLTIAQESVLQARRASHLICPLDTHPRSSGENQDDEEATLLEEQLQAQLQEQLQRQDPDVCATVAYMTRVGRTRKTGYAYKQSKLLGRWRKRFFVLDDQLLLYFENEREYVQALAHQAAFRTAVKGGKVLHLTARSIASYTTTSLCFSVTSAPPSQSSSSTALSTNTSSNNSATIGDEEWFLLAQNESELDDWLRCINAHIHIAYLTETETPLAEDYWDVGTVARSLWKVPLSSSSTSSTSATVRRPVGIRSVPDVHGPRTGEGLFPGDLVEIVQIVTEAELRPHLYADKKAMHKAVTDGHMQRYLRLAGDRGWVFENHPTGHYAILERAAGQCIEARHTYEYGADNLDDLIVYSNPQCRADQQTGYALQPGDRFEGVAEWRVSVAAFNKAHASATSSSMVAGDEADDDAELCFVRLRDGSGWVEMIHAVTGGQLVTRLD